MKSEIIPVLWKKIGIERKGMKPGSGLKDSIILIKGAGEKASAVAHRLHQCGLGKIVMSDLTTPLAERRGVSFCEAIIEGEKEVCEVVAQRAELSMEMIHRIWAEGEIPVLADPGTRVSRLIRPDILIDAVMAKRNTGTKIEDAPLVIALGPGFVASKDSHFVVETNPDSHYLGRVISNGQAEENTGTPTSVSGLTVERTIKAPEHGILRSCKKIGDKVKKNEVIAHVNEYTLEAPISGVIWGLMRDGVKVRARQKIGDIDPRGKRSLCFELAPRARAIAGGVLEAILRFYNR
jgi:xanthine dehydrogenase accessory factor